jgi:hypothetical protein
MARDLRAAVSSPHAAAQTPLLLLAALQYPCLRRRFQASCCRVYSRALQPRTETDLEHRCVLPLIPLAALQCPCLRRRFQASRCRV